MARGWAATVVAMLLLVGCSSPASEPRDERPAPEATLGLTQLIPLEGTRHALLRVTNTGDDPLVVRSVALAWPGYAGGEPSPADPTIPAGATLDLRLELPDPTCEPTEATPEGVVETAAGTLRAALEPSGTTYLRRLWRTQCDAVLLREAVAIGYSARWQVVGTGVDARARGDLVLRRRGEEAVTVTDVDGSVLHGLRLPGSTALPVGVATARVPLEITPGNRCDEHARGQATAPFDFLMHLRVGDGPRIAAPVEVPLAAMQAATRALDLACAARAG